MPGPYDIYPAVDAAYNFPQQIRTALLASPDVQAALNTSRDSAITSAVSQAVQQAVQQAATAAEKAKTGMVQAFAGSVAPAGWLVCDGTAVSRSTYSDLFAVIGTSYGPGDGTNTFNLPNLKGRVLAGLDASQTEFASVSKTGGEKTHTLLTSEMPTHSHGVNDPGHNHSQNAHGHGISDPGHGHGVYDPGHGHGISDPGHGHSASSGANGFMLYTNGSVTRSRFASGTNGNYAFQSSDQNALIFGGVNGSGTGISVNGSGTGIGIYGNGTGIGVQNTTASNNPSGTGIGIQNTGDGGAHNILQPYMTMNYVIHV